ncbi:hypothetical protein [Candidatus Lokiarchaeum ossiferum]|uniref:hypothetical protein n=1 Tax=Candidatus Lokiarchaeum ossiferum TaxID=2951803 RepID=UPI00352DBA38
MSVLLNSRNVLHPQSVHQTYVMTYQRRTAISCLLLALFSEAIFILLMFKKIITSISGGITQGFSFLFSLIAWIFLTLKLRVDFQGITLSHIFRTKKFKFSQIKSIHPTHEENWLEHVRSNEAYYLLVKFSGWKLKKRIPLTGWYRKNEKIDHNILCDWIMQKYHYHHPEKTKIFPR